MGSTVDATTTPSTLIPDTPELPADVILSILKDLHEIQNVSNLRVVSKQFDALIVSISYRHVYLTERILAPFANEQERSDDASTVQVALQVARDVRNHARHLTIKRNLDWYSVAKLVKWLKNLRSFTWAYWPSDSTVLHESPSSPLGPVLCKKWPNVQLHFEGVRASSHQPSDFEDFPNSNLVSCRIAAWETRQLHKIKELLFERPRLQELHLLRGAYGIWMRPKIKVREDRKIKSLPALRTLIIDGYDWNYSQWEMSCLWNWSNITHLELRNVQAIELLQHVPPQDLAGLKIFIEKCDSNYEESKYKRKSKLLCDLVRHTIALEELKIHCDTQKSEIVSALARHCLHLRVLRLRCFRPYYEPSWTALTLDQLDTIDSNCSHLMQIEVDVELPTFSHAMYAKARSISRIVGTPASTINTRSMSKTQAAKREANIENGDHVHDAKLKDEQAKQKIPRWYTEAYDHERYEKPGRDSWRRIDGLNASSSQQRSYSQARNEYLAWKQMHRKEEVSIMRNQARINSAPALAKFRNLRRLRVFTRLHHFTAQEPEDKTAARTRKAIQSWLNELLSKKQGAQFEEVVIYATFDVINEKEYTIPEYSQLTFTYTGKMDAGGNAEIGEEYGHWIE